MPKKAVLLLLQSPKLISRKIWLTEKSWIFHTVYTQKAFQFFRLISYLRENIIKVHPSLCWKFQDFFFAFHILCQIVLGHFKTLKTDILSF